MSMYEALGDKLRSAEVDSVPMTFAEIERLIRRPLPKSARAHQPFWANSYSHSHAKSWLDAGWRTRGVDLASERLTFVKAPTAPVAASASSSSNIDSANHGGEHIYININNLLPAAQDYLAQLREDFGLDMEGAVRAALNTAGRRMMVERWAIQSPKTTSDSVQLLHEGRNER